MNINLKNVFFSLLISSCFLSCFTQSHMTSNYEHDYYRRMHKTHLEPGGQLLTAWYHNTEEKSKDGKYIFKSFYPEKQTMTARIEYSDTKMSIKDGKFAHFSDDGILSTEGQYKVNNKIGEWKYYDWEFGYLKEKGLFVLDKKEGVWTNYDSLGLITGTYTYKNGEKNGVYQIFEAGELYEHGTFLKDEVALSNMVTEGTKSRIKSLNSANKNAGEIMPKFVGCDSNLEEEEGVQCAQNKMLEFIYSNIKYPKKARTLGVEGIAVIRFIVDKDGSLKDIKALRGICSSIESECLRIVKLMPNWIPGEKNGEKIPVYFNLPVKFKLE